MVKAERELIVVVWGQVPHHGSRGRAPRKGSGGRRFSLFSALVVASDDIKTWLIFASRKFAHNNTATVESRHSCTQRRGRGQPRPLSVSLSENVLPKIQKFPLLGI